MDDLARSLLGWYDRERRDLPWRSEPSAYRTLLSEIMLQQTRVETVIPYFERFVARWPTLRELAAASDEEVLSEWAGLGYYRRARSLLAAARAASAMGGLPRSEPELRALPGIGPYTAGAIASIAFGAHEVAIDGNVERVMSRLRGDERDPTRPAVRRAMRADILDLQPEDRPGDFNQALMELGAVICTPRAPSCDRCPWSLQCRGRALGIHERLPNKPKKPKPVPEAGVAGILRIDGRVLLARREAGARLGGLWEPPRAPLAKGEEPTVVLERAFAQRTGVPVQVGAHLGRVVHVFTHRKLSLEVFEVVPRGVCEPAAALDYDAAALLRLDGAPALSKLAHKVLALAQNLP